MFPGLDVLLEGKSWQPWLEGPGLPVFMFLGTKNGF